MSGSGAAIDARFLHSATVFDSSFVGNSAASLGGGAYVDTLTSVSIRNSTFDNNVAQNSGGGVYVASATDDIALANLTFTVRSVAVRVGCAFLASLFDTQVLTCLHAHYQDNTAGVGWGSGVYLLDVHGAVSDVTVTGSSGGNNEPNAVALQNGGSGTVIVFTRLRATCNAVYGLFVDGVGSNATLVDCVIAHNYAVGEYSDAVLAGPGEPLLTNVYAFNGGYVSPYTPPTTLDLYAACPSAPPCNVSACNWGAPCYINYTEHSASVACNCSGTGYPLGATCDTAMVRVTSRCV